MAEVEVDDTTVADTRLPASTFASTMRTMVISPTQQSSHCIFLINERERERKGEGERGGGGLGIFSLTLAAVQLPHVHAHIRRETDRVRERKKTDFLLFCSADACVTYLLPDFPATFFSCDFYTVFIVAFLLPLE